MSEQKFLKNDLKTLVEKFSKDDVITSIEKNYQKDKVIFVHANDIVENNSEPSCLETQFEITEDERFMAIAKRILDEHRGAFEELAK